MNWYKPSARTVLSEGVKNTLRDWTELEPFPSVPVWLMPIDLAFNEVRTWSYRSDDDRRHDFGYSKIVAVFDAMTYCEDHDIPPAIMNDGKLVDGKHRIIAAKLRGIKHIPVIRIEDCVG